MGFREGIPRKKKKTSTHRTFAVSEQFRDAPSPKRHRRGAGDTVTPCHPSVKDFLATHGDRTYDNHFHKMTPAYSVHTYYLEIYYIYGTYKHIIIYMYT